MYTLHTRLCTFVTDLHAQSVISSKISESELSRKFIKSALLVGKKTDYFACSIVTFSLLPRNPFDLSSSISPPPPLSGSRLCSAMKEWLFPLSRIPSPFFNTLLRSCILCRSSEVPNEQKTHHLISLLCRFMCRKSKNRWPNKSNPSLMVGGWVTHLFERWHGEKVRRKLSIFTGNGEAARKLSLSFSSPQSFYLFFLFFCFALLLSFPTAGEVLLNSSPTNSGFA